MNILLKLLVFNAISVTKTVLALFSSVFKSKSTRKNFKFWQSAKYMAVILDFKKGIAQYLWRHKSRAVLQKISILKLTLRLRISNCLQILSKYGVNTGMP